MQCGWPCASSIAINETLNTLPLNKWITLSIPLTCFKENMDFSKTNTPFIMTTTANAKLDLGLINWTPQPLIQRWITSFRSIAMAPRGKPSM
ncbi:hypothetical protein LNO81_29935 [Klebsiella variicola subsp. variicola]|nr:hypothetical protein [Klebsiella variicola subsp. variicola]